MFDGTARKTVVLDNEGFVALTYKITGVPDFLQISPVSGTISAKTKLTVTVEFVPRVPQICSGSFRVSISNGDREDIAVSGMATFPCVSVQLPRLYENEFASIHESATTKLQDPSPEALSAEVDRLTFVQFVANMQSTRTSKSKTELAALRPKLAPYVLDFGNVIIGGSASKSFSVRNTSPAPMNLQLNKKSLADGGFSVDIDKASNIPPNETVEFTVTFKALQKASLGANVKQLLPIDINASGPKLTVQLQANICEPTLTISESSVDFGTVECGNCQIVTVLLENNGSVPCTWSFARIDKRLPHGLGRKAQIVETRKREMDACFETLPSYGSLQPNETEFVQLRFLPKDASTCTTEMSIKIANSSRRPALKLSGSGIDPVLTFSSTMIELGPVLPQAVAAEQSIVISNPTPSAVELYILELDDLHIREAQALRATSGFDKKNRLFLPPRAAGQALSHEVFDDYKPSVVPDSDAVFLESSADGAQTTISIPAHEVGELKGHPAQRAIDRHLGIEAERRKRQLDCGGINLIVHGRFMSGKSVLAKAWSQQYHAIVLSVDAVIESQMQENTSLGVQVRQACQEGAERDEAEDGLYQRSRSALPPPDGERREHGSSTYLPKAVRLPENLVFEILQWRVNQPDAVNGVIFDGLLSKYTDMVTCAKAQLRALSHRENLYFVILDLDVATAIQRSKQVQENALKAQKAIEQADIAKHRVPELAEDEYDALSEEERDAYDKKVINWRKYLIQKQKESELRELERQRQAEEEERRMEEEKSKSKRGKAKAAGGKADIKIPAKRPELISRPGSSANHAETNADDGNEDWLVDRDQYDATLEAVCKLVDSWDKVKGEAFVVVSAAPVETVEQSKSTFLKNKTLSVKKESNHTVNAASVNEVPVPAIQPLAGFGIPRFALNAALELIAVKELLYSQSGIPSVLTFLTNIGVVKNGPALPQPYTLSVVPFPTERPQVQANPSFSVVDKVSVPAPQDSEADKDEEAIKTRPGTRETKRVAMTPSKKSAASKHAGTPGRLKDDDDTVEEQEPIAEVVESVKRSRWIVPAHGSVTCFVRFTSALTGNFDQSLTFETLNTKRQYTVFARGVCRFPRLESDPKVVFPKVLAKKQLTENIQQVYVSDTNVFEFGPVLCGMSRDDYKGEKFKRNVAKFNLQNPSSTDMHVTACLESDTAFATFTLDPPTQIIPANTTKQLRVWAYPKSQQVYEDQVVICVKDTPEPIAFGIRCEGVEPVVELEKKTLTFDRLLIHRKDTRYVTIYNKSKLAVAWSLHGLDQLGEDFTAPASKGTIDPMAAYKLALTFRSTKAVNIKKVYFINLDCCIRLKQYILAAHPC